MATQPDIFLPLQDRLGDADAAIRADLVRSGKPAGIPPVLREVLSKILDDAGKPTSALVAARRKLATAETAHAEAGEAHGKATAHAEAADNETEYSKRRVAVDFAALQVKKTAGAVEGAKQAFAKGEDKLRSARRAAAEQCRLAVFQFGAERLPDVEAALSKVALAELQWEDSQRLVANLLHIADNLDAPMKLED